MQPDDTTVRIPLRAHDGSVRAYALIDAADADFVNQWRWNLSTEGYAYRSSRRPSSVYLHRELLGLTPGDEFEGEHRNRNRLDCRRSNLMSLPKRGKPNAQNQGGVVGSSSVYRGVWWDKHQQRWKATVKVSGKKIHIGSFRDESEAGNAARIARARLMPYATD